MSEAFDENLYCVVDKSTGEEVDIAIFIKRASASGWERAYTKVLADYVGLSGNAVGKILAYLLRNKDHANMIYGTFQELADKNGVGRNTVSKVFKTLHEYSFIKRIRSGAYMLSPKMVRFGSNTKGAMLLRLWDESK